MIGTVAKLREEKGIRYLVESAPVVAGRFPDVIFLIAGDGPQRKELEILSRGLELEDRIRFAGFCGDIPAILSLIRIVTIPSLTEGSPMALLESMATGKPIVATGVGGIPEILEDGVTGLFVPPADSSKLAEKLCLLVEKPDLAAALGTRAKAKSLEYDINLHVRKLEEIYSDILDKVP